MHLRSPRHRAAAGRTAAWLALALSAGALAAPATASAHHRDSHAGGPPWLRDGDRGRGHGGHGRGSRPPGQPSDWEFGPELEQHLREMEQGHRRPPVRPRPRGGDRPVRRPRPRRRTAAPRAPRVPYGRLIASTARRYRLPVALLTALVWQESNFRARARSPAGAQGLTQLMPATARMLGVRRPYDPRQNLDGGARYLKAMLRTFRSKRLALAGYNAGPGAVRRYGGVPPYAETRHYVRRVLAYEARLRRSGIR